MRSSNPTLTPEVFRATTVSPAGLDGRQGVMTVEGTAYKSLLLVVIAAVTAGLTYTTQGGTPTLGGLTIVAVLAMFGLGIFTAFKPRAAIITGPLYAVVSGAVLGAISAVYEVQYDGIVAQAVVGTFATAIAMLLAYSSGIIRVTSTFRKVVTTATFGIVLMYVISIVLGLFGIAMPLLNSASPLGIALSVGIVTIAALNLVLDFDFIAQAAESRAVEARMEWYGAFGLLVTLVWLYLEILRLLSKLRR